MPEKYEVLTNTLFRIDHSAGFRADESPKRVVEHRKGDVIEFEDNDINKDRVQELLAAGAIAPAKDQGDQQAPRKPATTPTQASGA
jgi:hypothetical protein